MSNPPQGKAPEPRLVGGRAALLVTLIGSIGTLLALASLPDYGASHTAQRDTSGIEDLVFVYEGYSAGDIPGCGAISAFNLETGEVLYRGEPAPGHGQLAMSPQLNMVAAQWSQGGAGTIYMLELGGREIESWRQYILDPPDGVTRGLTKGGIMFTNDGNDLLFGESVRTTSGVAAHALSEIVDERLGPNRGFFRITNASSSVLIPDPDESISYAVTDDSQLYVLDTDIVAARRSAIFLPPIVRDESDVRGGRRGHHVHASLALDQRHVVVNRWNTPSLSNADLKVGTAKPMPLPEDLGTTGGVAFNWGWENPGLLATHNGNSVSVFDYDPFASLVTERARIAIESPRDAYDEMDWPGFIAWSTSGSHIIAGTSEDSSEFVTLRVNSCGDEIVKESLIAVCPPAESNSPKGIVTANGLVLTPDAYSGSCPTPWWLPEPLPTDTLPTPTETGSAPTPTETDSAREYILHLPVSYSH